MFGDGCILSRFERPVKCTLLPGVLISLYYVDSPAGLSQYCPEVNPSESATILRLYFILQTTVELHYSQIENTLQF